MLQLCIRRHMALDRPHILPSPVQTLYSERADLHLGCVPHAYRHHTMLRTLPQRSLMDIPQTEMHISWLIEVWFWLLICLTLMFDGEEVCDGLYITSHNLRLLIQGDTSVDLDRDKFFLWFYLCEGERYGEAKKDKGSDAVCVPL